VHTSFKIILTQFSVYSNSISVTLAVGVNRPTEACSSQQLATALSTTWSMWQWHC